MQFAVVALLLLSVQGRHNHKNHRPVLRQLQQRDAAPPGLARAQIRSAGPPTVRLVERPRKAPQSLLPSNLFLLQDSSMLPSRRNMSLLPPKLFLLQEDSKTGNGKAREEAVRRLARESRWARRPAHHDPTPRRSPWQTCTPG